MNVLGQYAQRAEQQRGRLCSYKTAEPGAATPATPSTAW